MTEFVQSSGYPDVVRNPDVHIEVFWVDKMLRELHHCDSAHMDDFTSHDMNRLKAMSQAAMDFHDVLTAQPPLDLTGTKGAGDRLSDFPELPILSNPKAYALSARLVAYRKHITNMASAELPSGYISVPPGGGEMAGHNKEQTDTFWSQYAALLEQAESSPTVHTPADPLDLEPPQGGVE